MLTHQDEWLVGVLDADDVAGPEAGRYRHQQHGGCQSVIKNISFTGQYSS